VRALLDPSVLIGAEDAGDLECAISAASLAELHFGVLVAADEDERARRALRLGVISSNVCSSDGCGRACVIRATRRGCGRDGRRARTHADRSGRRDPSSR
jgi:hypothetical protein